jgi:hypothetical protein
MFVMLIITNLAIGHQVQVLDQFPTFEKCEKRVPLMQQLVGPQGDAICIPIYR